VSAALDHAQKATCASLVALAEARGRHRAVTQLLRQARPGTFEAECLAARVERAQADVDAALSVYFVCLDKEATVRQVPVLKVGQWVRG